MNTINNRIINEFQSSSKHMNSYNKEALEKYEVEKKVFAELLGQNNT